MENAKIVNIVASANIIESFDLETISKALGINKYKQKKFPGLIYKLKNPKCAILIFKNGKIVCTGTKTLEEVQKVIKIMVHKLINIFAKRIEDSSFPLNRNPKINIENIVATYDLGYELNLNSLALEIGFDKIEYEPEQFPGIVYRIKYPKVVALIFGTGKIVITGAKKVEDIDLAINNIKEDLNKIEI